MGILDEAITDLVHGYVAPNGRRGAAALAPLLNIPAGTLTNQADPNVRTHHLSVRHAVTAQTLQRRYPVFYAEGQILHHACIPLRCHPEVSDVELSRLYPRYYKQLGDTMGEIDRAVTARSLTQEELTRIEKKINEAVQVMLELTARLGAIVDE